MKVVFVYPDFESLGVEYLVSSCRARGHEVELVFYRAEDTFIATKQAIDYDRLAKSIVAKTPDVVAFSCVTDNYRYQLACSIELKKILPRVLTVFGGVHATAVPENVISQASVDCVAVGEAEETFCAFLEMCEQSGGTLPREPVPGMLVKIGGDIVNGLDLVTPGNALDTLPFPDKSIYLPYVKEVVSAYKIITSRGCPFSCSYCFNSYAKKFSGKHPVRRRSVENVIAELKLAKSRYDLKTVLFVDDVFTMSKKWLSDFLKLYKSEIGLTFSCNTHHSFLDDEVAKMLKESGCVSIQVGIQSLSESLCRDVLLRRSNNKLIANTIATIKNNGMIVQVDHMLGVPGDTVKMQEDALLFYNEHRPDLISIFWLTYFPKTTIVDIALRSHVLSGADISRIENGERIGDGSYYAGGDAQDTTPFLGLSFLMNWLYFLPKGVVVFLVRRRLYRFLSVKSFLLGTALPRVLRSLIDPRDFRGRDHLFRFLSGLFQRRQNDY